MTKTKQAKAEALQTKQNRTKGTTDHGTNNAHTTAPQHKEQHQDAISEEGRSQTGTTGGNEFSQRQHVIVWQRLQLL